MKKFYGVNNEERKIKKLEPIFSANSWRCNCFSAVQFSGANFGVVIALSVAKSAAPILAFAKIFSANSFSVGMKNSALTILFPVCDAWVLSKDR